MKTEKHTPFQPIIKERKPPPADGDFDEVARLTKEVLGVPFVYVSLIDYRTKTSGNGFQNGKGGVTPEQPATVSMSPQSFLSKIVSNKDPDKLKIALAKSKGLHFCATLPLYSSKSDRLGKLYIFAQTSEGWGDFHWNILSAVAKIITHRVELQWDAYQSLISKNTNNDHEGMSVLN